MRMAAMKLPKGVTPRKFARALQAWREKKAFSQRRKVARNSLRPLYEPGEVAAALAALGLSEDARAQVTGSRQGLDGAGLGLLHCMLVEPP